MTDRMPCKDPDCEGQVEANPDLYLSLWADNSWSVEGVSDECTEIVCDSCGADNRTELADKAMTAFLEALLPGTTWQGSDPRHPLGEDTVTLRLSHTAYQAIKNLVPEHLQDAVVFMDGMIV